MYISKYLWHSDYDIYSDKHSLKPNQNIYLKNNSTSIELKHINMLSILYINVIVLHT